MLGSESTQPSPLYPRTWSSATSRVLKVYEPKVHGQSAMAQTSSSIDRPSQVARVCQVCLESSVLVVVVPP